MTRRKERAQSQARGRIRWAVRKLKDEQEKHRLELEERDQMIAALRARLQALEESLK